MVCSHLLNKGIAALSLHFRFADTTSAFEFIRCLTQAHMNMVGRLAMCMCVCCTACIYMQRDTLSASTSHSRWRSTCIHITFIDGSIVWLRPSCMVIKNLAIYDYRAKGLFVWDYNMSIFNNLTYFELIV